jgi:pimeloyl-ACP methyl ester carboxylesterase
MPEINKEILVRISAITIMALLLTISIGALFLSNPANGQTSCDNGTIIRSNEALSVILVHGYNEGSWVWSAWERLLQRDHISFCTVSFHQSDDECGLAIDHTRELSQIVQEVRSLTGQNQVNIVGHSKGGLDARVYLDQSRTHNVANLIMIGTPNRGDPLANEAASVPPFFDFTNFFCRPAVYDLKIGADDTNAHDNPNTNYYTIYGDWNPSLTCPLLGFEDDGYRELNNLGAGHNDGIVPVSSALGHFTNLGHTNHCHTGLLTNQEYNIAKTVLAP